MSTPPETTPKKLQLQNVVQVSALESELPATGNDDCNKSPSWRSSNGSRQASKQQCKRSMLYMCNNLLLLLLLLQQTKTKSMSAELSTLFKFALIAVVVVVVAVAAAGGAALFYGCRVIVAACSTCIKYAAYFVAHGRQKSVPLKVGCRCCCCSSSAAFHAVNYYYRRVSVHLSGLSGRAQQPGLAATHPTTCNKTALRHRHRQTPKHTDSDRDVWSDV